jgi:acyl-[acyl-carrier-protein]-phospholipid O-acyltransferase/long-chain-fatty-acid--[acyl-carrier-protein] ligase
MEQDDGQKQPTRRDWVGYWSMIVQQTQNAFNDKAAQFLLIPLGGWLLREASRVEHIAGLLIVLPFILFAPVAGWLSDRFSKRNVMLGAAIAQFMILCLLSCSLWIRSLNLALVGFFLLALQSAIFSPAKLGIVKELVGSARLGFASGLQQMTSMLAILIGQVLMGYLFDARLEESGDGWSSALGPLMVIAICAVPAIGLAMVVPRTPTHGAGPLKARLLWSHVGQMVELWRSPVLRRTALGIAFFWGFGGFINLWSIGVAKEMTGGGPGFGVFSSNLMLAASLGMAGGFGVASLLCRRRIELGWVPLAGIMMTVLVLLLAMLNPESPVFLVALGSAAFAAAVFLVPLNAYLQDKVEPSRRGSIIAAVNLQDCIAGLAAVVLQGGFTWAYHAMDKPVWLGFRGQLVFAALLTALVTWRVVRRLPSDMIRVVGLPFIRWNYRLRAVGAGECAGKRGCVAARQPCVVCGCVHRDRAVSEAGALRDGRGLRAEPLGARVHALVQHRVDRRRASARGDPCDGGGAEGRGLRVRVSGGAVEPHRVDERTATGLRIDRADERSAGGAAVRGRGVGIIFLVQRRRVFQGLGQAHEIPGDRGIR